MTREGNYDVIVIGSGMGGMTTATALSRMNHKVLLLEQARNLGGLTHTFSREGFSWDVGIHYCGTFRRDQPGGQILDWLSGGTVEFRSVGTVYDTLHFPDGFELAVGRPADAFKMELKDRFPGHAAEIDAYFEALQSGVVQFLPGSVVSPGPEVNDTRWPREETLWVDRAIGSWFSIRSESH